MEGARSRLEETLERCSASELRDWTSLKARLRDVLSDYIFEITKRSPMILPIIMEV
jgi:ribonuclease J